MLQLRAMAALALLLALTSLNCIPPRIKRQFPSDAKADAGTDVADNDVDQQSPPLDTLGDQGVPEDSDTTAPLDATGEDGTVDQIAPDGSEPDGGSDAVSDAISLDADADTPDGNDPDAQCPANPSACECQSDNDCNKLDTTCAKGSCSPQKSCVTTPINEGNPCDDTNVCTANDKCLSGTCKGEPRFGLPCGSGTEEQCDLKGACVLWASTSMKPGSAPDGIVKCAFDADCLVAGTDYQCRDGLCVCTPGSGAIECDCGPALKCRGRGSICIVRDDIAQPGQKIFDCGGFGGNLGALCTPVAGGERSPYFVRESLLSGEKYANLGVEVRRLEGTTVADVLRSEVTEWFDSVVCTSDLVFLSDGFQTPTTLTVLARDGGWNAHAQLVAALKDAIGQSFSPSQYRTLFSRIDDGGKRLVYVGGTFSGDILNTTSQSLEKHSNFVIRCAETAPGGPSWSCQRVDLLIHDGVTVLHKEILPEGLDRPPYGSQFFTVHVTGLWAGAQTGVERLYALTHVFYDETINSQSPLYSGELIFSYATLVGGAPSAKLTYADPFGCVGSLGGTCETVAPRSDFGVPSFSMLAIDGSGERVLLVAKPKVPIFDFETNQIVPTGFAQPSVGRVFFRDAGGWTELSIPKSALLDDDGQLGTLPYEFIFDQVRLVDADNALLVGHYRTCVGLNCKGSGDITVKSRVFAMSLHLPSKTFAPMLALGDPVTTPCCLGDSCPKVDNGKIQVPTACTERSIPDFISRNSARTLIVAGVDAFSGAYIHIKRTGSVGTFFEAEHDPPLDEIWYLPMANP